MSTLQISLPDQLRDFVDREASKAGFTSASAFVEALVAEAQRARNENTLEQELIKGITSGDPVEANDSFWASFRARNRVRLGRTA